MQRWIRLSQISGSDTGREAVGTERRETHTWKSGKNSGTRCTSLTVGANY